MLIETRKKVLGEKFARTFNIESRDFIDEENRTVELAFASEEPYERWWGVEIIDLKKMDLSRLNDGAALLWNHNHDSHIGKVEKGLD